VLRKCNLDPNINDKAYATCILEENIKKNIWPNTREWNSEIYILYKYLNIMDDIKIRRLGWAGHIIRTENERITKRFLMGSSTT
jgi:hypothetical protein